jgi:hypothetical protein
MLRNGYALAGKALPQQQSFFTFINSENSLRLNSEIPDSRIEVPNKMLSAQTGKLNLVPLGILYLFMYYANTDPLTITVKDAAGSLYDSYSGIKTSDGIELVINLKDNISSNYTTLIPLPFYEHFQSSSGSLLSTGTEIINGSSKKISIKIKTTNIGVVTVHGHIMIYGIL